MGERRTMRATHNFRTDRRLARKMAAAVVFLGFLGGAGQGLLAENVLTGLGRGDDITLIFNGAGAE